ncbi:hypothetical protein SynBIOSE41_02740 [Synechococcus sp. BIOS-E4-1]|nr:hypothetical protein SynBIOSE41_02740 [Synechococcus sp. BIOS-E4-1]
MQLIHSKMFRFVPVFQLMRVSLISRLLGSSPFDFRIAGTSVCFGDFFDCTSALLLPSLAAR